VFLIDPTQVAEGFSQGQGVGVSVSKPYGGHPPWLDGEDYSTAKSAELLVLSVVVPWALSDTEALSETRVELNKLW
jgi:hypothetical protein